MKIMWMTLLSGMVSFFPFTNVQAKNIRVAVIQMESKNNAKADNLLRAKAWIEKASAQGAQLILLPEFMPNGYIFDKVIWQSAETKDGPTLKMLTHLSESKNVYIGTTFLEAQGSDFYNTFVLTCPDGQKHFVRKSPGAAFETFFAKDGQTDHCFNTPIGVIGVSICYEGQLAKTKQIFFDCTPDLILMPHSAPTPAPIPLLSTQKDAERFNASIRILGKDYAQTFGVPVLVCNKVGVWISPLPGWPFSDQESRFPGLSVICDSNGQVKAQAEDQEQMLVADVNLDPQLKKNTKPVCYGRKALEPNWNDNLWRIYSFFGRISYKMSRERKNVALKISGNNESVVSHGSEFPSHEGK